MPDGLQDPPSRQRAGRTSRRPWLVALRVAQDATAEASWILEAFWRRSPRPAAPSRAMAGRGSHPRSAGCLLCAVCRFSPLHDVSPTQLRCKRWYPMQGLGREHVVSLCCSGSGAAAHGSPRRNTTPPGSSELYAPGDGSSAVAAFLRRSAHASGAAACRAATPTDAVSAACLRACRSSTPFWYPGWLATAGTAIAVGAVSARDPAFCPWRGLHTDRKIGKKTR